MNSMTSFSWLRGSQNSGLEVLRLEGVDMTEMAFPSGDTYKGGWREDQPEGEGRYTWADGATYEGSWSNGLRHGWGKYQWPGGACYLGEWRGGRLQGYGTFTAPDGTRYQGSWAENVKQGYGTKWHANGDRYEGLWSQGVANGPGRYKWANGDEFDGEWRGGKMHGRGTFKWADGRRYDGDFADGAEEGLGVFTWPDGSSYEGFWSGGVKHGVGVFRTVQQSGDKVKGGRGHRRSLSLTGRVRNAGAGEGPQVNHQRRGSGGDRPAEAALVELFGEYGNVYVCEYEQGNMVLKEALTTDELELILGPDAARERQPSAQQIMRRRSHKRRESLMGQTIFKGSPSFDLMLNVQLGVRYTLGTLSKLPPPPAILPEHFRQKVWLRFPREGSEVTPPHPSRDFKWKDYAPTAFRHLRGVFNITNSDYILSLCGDRALRELPSPGKSGSIFWVSQDEQFLIKTMRKEEVELLLSALPRYCAHVTAHPGTLLTRFYGLHRVTPAQGRKVRFVVMNNIFRTDLPIHRKFDLKGSTFKRTAGVAMASTTTVFKDLDLDSCFKMTDSGRIALLKQLSADCAFLEGAHVMDYSLLLGVHFRNKAEVASPEPGDAAGREAHTETAHADAAESDVELHPAIGDQGEHASSAVRKPAGSADAGVTSAALTSSIAVSTAKPRPAFGLHTFLNWRREKKEKKIQKARQDLGIRDQDRSRHGSGAPVPVSRHPVPSRTEPAARSAVQQPPPERLPMSAGAYQPDSQIPSMAQLPTSGEAQPRQRVFSAAGAVTYNQQLTMQHAALVAALAGVECSTPHAGNAATSGSGEQVSSNGIDNSIGAEGIAWRADAAIIPDEGLASADVYAPPNTPSAGALTPGDTLGGSRYDSINYPGLSPGLSSIFEGVAHGSPSSSGSMTLGRADTSEDLSLTSNSSVLDRTRSDPTSAVAAVDGLREAVAVMRSEASAVDLTAPEAAAMVSRIAGRLSRPLSDRVVQDLLRLARYKLLGPGVSGGKLERVPASVLATTQAARPGSAVRSVEDAAAATRPAANQLLATALSNPKEAMGSRSGAGATDVDGLDGSEDVILFVGLIDWLQPYNMRKKVEHRVKSVVQDAKGISVQEPKTYSRRFLGFMEKVFVA